MIGCKGYVGRKETKGLNQYFGMWLGLMAMKNIFETIRSNSSTHRVHDFNYIVFVSCFEHVLLILKLVGDYEELERIELSRHVLLFAGKTSRIVFCRQVR